VDFTIANLSESIFSTLGVPGCLNSMNLTTNPYARECLVLIDGFGKNAFDQYCISRSIATRFEYQETLKATFPSTTAASLTSLGTGLAVGEHGMVGYTMKVPNSGYPERILNALKWDERVDPEVWQPNPTLFERAAKSGISVNHVAAARFATTGFTRAALRGAEYRSANSISDQVATASEALRKPRSFVYLYLNDVDEASHARGFGSDKFLAALDKVDALVDLLVKELPSGTRIWLTSDHGMINQSEYTVIGVENNLLDGVDLMAGEPRVRYLYLKEDQVDVVANRWREFFGDKVAIKTREAAVSAGMFGKSVKPEFLERIGELIIIANGGLILVEKEREALQIAMMGHHGGVTKEEIEVPLLVTDI
jgi:predicted AlkP superfamily pyrophosphatase or phosphodiesterase